MQKRLGLDLEVSDEFGIGLAWYTVGEAHFLAHISKPDKNGYRQLQLRYVIGLRDDDRPGLEYIRQILGVGSIHIRYKDHERWNAQAIYKVSTLADLYHIIVPLFEKYPLPQQWRKAEEFEIWKRLVSLKYHENRHRTLRQDRKGRILGRQPYRQQFWDKAIPLVHELLEVRAYSPPS